MLRLFQSFNDLFSSRRLHYSWDMAEPAGSQDQSSSLEIENRVDDAFAEIANTLPTRDKNTFTGRELRVLELWDRLEDLRLERTLVETQIELSRGESVMDTAKCCVLRRLCSTSLCKSLTTGQPPSARGC